MSRGVLVLRFPTLMRTDRNSPEWQKTWSVIVCHTGEFLLDHLVIWVVCLCMCVVS